MSDDGYLHTKDVVDVVVKGGWRGSKLGRQMAYILEYYLPDSKKLNNRKQLVLFEKGKPVDVRNATGRMLSAEHGAAKPHILDFISKSDADLLKSWQVEWGGSKSRCGRLRDIQAKLPGSACNVDKDVYRGIAFDSVDGYDTILDLLIEGRSPKRRSMMCSSWSMEKRVGEMFMGDPDITPGGVMLRLHARDAAKRCIVNLGAVERSFDLSGTGISITGENEILLADDGSLDLYDVVKLRVPSELADRLHDADNQLDLDPDELPLLLTLSRGRKIRTEIADTVDDLQFDPIPEGEDEQFTKDQEYLRRSLENRREHVDEREDNLAPNTLQVA